MQAANRARSTRQQDAKISHPNEVINGRGTCTLWTPTGPLAYSALRGARRVGNIGLSTHACSASSLPRPARALEATRGDVFQGGEAARRGSYCVCLPSPPPPITRERGGRGGPTAGPNRGGAGRGGAACLLRRGWPQAAALGPAGGGSRRSHVALAFRLPRHQYVIDRQGELSCAGPGWSRWSARWCPVVPGGALTGRDAAVHCLAALRPLLAPTWPAGASCRPSVAGRWRDCFPAGRPRMALRVRPVAGRGCRAISRLPLRLAAAAAPSRVKPPPDA